MTDALTLLLTRRSVAPAMLAEPAPDGEALTNILTAALRVPDHGKLTPWRLILFRGEDRARFGERLAALFQDTNPDAQDRLVDAEQQRFMRAPLVICVVSRAAPHVKIPEWEQVLSSGAVCLNLLHAAHAQGFGASWLTEWPAYDERVRKILGLAPNERVAGFVYIGTPEQAPGDRPRPRIEDVVTDWTGEEAQ